MSKQIIGVLPSAARTTAQSVKIGPLNGRGLIVVLDVTADPAAASITLSINGYDPVSAKTWTILDGAAVAATGTTVYRVDPELTASANAIAKDIVPQHVEIAVAVADTDSLTYSVTAFTS